MSCSLLVLLVHVSFADYVCLWVWCFGFQPGIAVVGCLQLGVLWSWCGCIECWIGCDVVCVGICFVVLLFALICYIGYLIW